MAEIRSPIFGLADEPDHALHRKMTDHIGQANDRANDVERGKARNQWRQQHSRGDQHGTDQHGNATAEAIDDSSYGYGKKHGQQPEQRDQRSNRQRRALKMNRVQRDDDSATDERRMIEGREEDEDI